MLQSNRFSLIRCGFPFGHSFNNSFHLISHTMPNVTFNHHICYRTVFFYIKYNNDFAFGFITAIRQVNVPL